MERTAEIEAILAAFEGRETTIEAAGRENTRTVNRLARIAPLRRIDGQTTFQRTVARYRIGPDRESVTVVIGAERAGAGVWRLIARWEREGSEAGP